MAVIVFSNPNTAAQFIALTEYDHFVEIPPRVGGTCACHAYRGPISDITPCAAERYIEYKGNLIAKKETPDPLQEEGAASPALELVDDQKKNEEESNN